MFDHRSYTQLSSCRKNSDFNGLEPTTSVIPLQCSANCAFKPINRGARHVVSSQYTSIWWKIQLNEYMKDQIFELREKCKDRLITAVLHTTLIKAVVK